MIFAATWLDLEIIILSEVTLKERQVPYNIINLKYDTNEQLIYETDSQTQ